MKPHTLIWIAGPIIAACSALSASPSSHSQKVLVDGIFASDEWTDARRFTLSSDTNLYVETSSNALLIAVQHATHQKLFVDLYIEDATGRLINLHASMKVGERTLPGDAAWDDAKPPYLWGNNLQWEANAAPQTESAAGSSLEERLAPSEGYEFRIPFNFLGPGPWKVRAEVRDFLGVAPELVWPTGSSRASSLGWFEIEPDASRPAA